MAQRVAAIKRWSDEARALVLLADRDGHAQRLLETSSLVAINDGLDKDAEKDALKLEAIAAIHHLPERKRAKRRRYMQCIKRDHLYDTFMAHHSLCAGDTCL